MTNWRQISKLATTDREEWCDKLVRMVRHFSSYWGGVVDNLGGQMRRIGRESAFVMKNINKSFLFTTILPFFHFFSCAPQINKLVIIRILSSSFYPINYCVFDTYEFVPKRARQKGKILPNLPLTSYRQNSKMIKILYIKKMI